MLLISLGAFLASFLAYRVLYSGSVTFPWLAAPLNVSAVCLEIESSVSSASGVFFNGTEQYARGIYHMAISSTQEAACSFEPGTPEDVGIALQILGRTRCPFAVKSGGHATNLGFSSTSGVQIAMHRFSDVTYDSATRTANIGAGLIWDDVYDALEPHGVNVAGGRVSGIGVAGFTLGGGYSWHANQYGLTLDTVEAFELVLPNGTVTNVNASHPDLFFGLRGGFNNFGVVTRFTFRTFPQTEIWGGYTIYGPSEADQFTKATANFAANNTDPKANIIATYGYARHGNVSESYQVAMIFYDAPSPPAGLFDDFMTIDHNGGAFTQSFSSFLRSSKSDLFTNLRTAFHTAPVHGYPEDFVRYLENERSLCGTTFPVNEGHVTFNIQPFLPSVYDHSTSPSAWPGSRAFFSPLNIAAYWANTETTDDVIIIDKMKECMEHVREKAGVAEQLSLYGNYALADTPLEAIYGANVERLRRIRKTVDPKNVMGLTGGFKF